MKVKLDENFGTSIQKLFTNTGHDIHTVLDQGIKGCSDETLYDVCCSEQHCLVTLDLDFADITRFQPTKTGGIVVIRVPKHSGPQIIEKLIQQFLKALTEMSVEKNLWIVESGRIRIHQLENEY